MKRERRAVLYVDDEESNLVVFEAAFEDIFDVHLAKSAQEALDLLKSTPVPVVVADQRMPDVTGIEMFQILRQQAPHIQRVILSGFTEPDALIDAINDGQIFQFVRKPWDRSELLTVLRRAMDAHDLSLQNSILREKLALAERCSMLGQSAAKIAHEMGNQLGMLPLIEVIEDEYTDDEQLQELAAMSRMTHIRLQQLVNEIQSFVRTDAIEIRPVAFSLFACINELLSYLRFNQTVDLNRIRVILQEDSVILGNPFKLQQVLINLMRNGIDAVNDCEQGLVEIRLERVNQFSQIVITDNGHGISEDNLENIWRPFFTTKGKSGTGLGLDVVKSIVDGHNGTITCESVVGHGTTFEIRLPVSMQTPDDPKINSTAPHIQSLTQDAQRRTAIRTRTSPSDT